MASAKRELSLEDEKSHAKKPKVDETVRLEDSYHPMPESKQRVVLNAADCDLDFNIEGNGLLGSALHEEGFAYCWSGARANVGITGGKYYFSCKVISAQPVDMEDTPPDQQHVCRVGISRGDDRVGNLGETEHSFGFGGTGKFSTSGKFSDYGEKFGVGDTIICAVNLEDRPTASIGFYKNGSWMGIAKHFDASLRGLGVIDSPRRNLQWKSAVFPHVLLKNVVVEAQFSVEEGLPLVEEYEPWANALKNGNAILGPTYSNPRDCEVMMMVGLPASGKTTWAEKWIKEHPEKRYILLGTNLVLDQMKVPGLLRKNNYGERFDRLMNRATGIFNVLLSRAVNIPRNYIIDQTNVYKSARKRKLKPFSCFKKIAVVIFPTPQELKIRSDKRFKDMGKEVPPEAVNEMTANFILPMSKYMPGSDELFDQVIFTELNRVEAQRYLDEMKHAVVDLQGNPAFSRGSSSHAQETFIQSRGRPAAHLGGDFPVKNEPRQSSHVPPHPSNSNCWIPDQVNYARQGPRPFGNSRLIPPAYHPNQFPSPLSASTPYEPNSFVPGGSVPYEAIASPFASRAQNLFDTYPTYRSLSPPRYQPPGSRYSRIPNPCQSYEIENTSRMPISGTFSPAIASRPYRSDMVESSPIRGWIRPSSHADNASGTRPAGQWRFPK